MRFSAVKCAPAYLGASSRIIRQAVLTTSGLTGRILPPIILTREQADEGLAILEQSIAAAV